MNKQFKKEMPNIIIFFFMVMFAGSLISGWMKTSTTITIHGNVTINQAPEPTVEPTTEVQKAIVRPATCREAIEQVFPEVSGEAMKVSFCESSLSHLARSTKSSAKGCFQIINSTWKLFKCEGDPLDPMDNAICARKIYDNAEAWNTSGGWKASYWCHKQI